MAKEFEFPPNDRPRRAIQPQPSVIIEPPPARVAFDFTASTPEHDKLQEAMRAGTRVEIDGAAYAREERTLRKHVMRL